MTAHDPGETSDAAFAPKLAGESASRPPGRRQLASTLADGYRASSPAEQAGFGMTVGFALALAGARKITYIQERRRGMPVLRGLARGALVCLGAMMCASTTTCRVSRSR